ncbi:MAG TPA: nucleoside phosphorylase [Candidatus Onthovivens sp.]|nr:nucleoside phosphorylase [Candidatus Onthovivens sp.]
MAIDKSFNEGKEIIKVSDIIQKYHRKYQTIIMTFQSRPLEFLLKNNLIEEIEDVTLGTSYVRIKLYNVKNNPEVIFIVSPIGAPTAVAALEELTYMVDAKNIIAYGSCGVLDEEVVAQRFIVPLKAYRDEGVSYHYLKASDYVEIKNHQFVSKVFEKNNLEFVKGNTWTTDAFYRETDILFEKRKAEGCISVEMEGSALEAFANFRHLNLYLFFYCSDALNIEKYDKRVLGTAEEGRTTNFDIALLIAREIENETNKTK